jgi:hypothetical protein
VRSDQRGKKKPCFFSFLRWDGRLRMRVSCLDSNPPKNCRLKGCGNLNEVYYSLRSNDWFHPSVNSESIVVLSLQSVYSSRDIVCIEKKGST